MSSIRNRRTLAAALTASATILGLAQAPAALAATHKPVLPTVKVCGEGATTTRPSGMILTCADNGEKAERLTWKSWTATSATATGLVAWRACTADCAHAKKWETATTQFTLSDPKAEPGSGTLFTKLTLHTTGVTPKGFMRDLSFNEAPVPSVPAISKRSALRLAVSPATAPSGTLGYAQIEGYWNAAGGPSSAAETAAAITGAESSFIPGIIQQGVDYCGSGSDRAGWGLWQITCGDSEPTYGSNFQLLDPWNNAEAAVSKYTADVAAGYNGFDPWSTYTSGAYTNFLQSVTPASGLTDPGEYTQDGSTPNGTPSAPAAAPGSTYGPAMPGSPQPSTEVAFNASGSNMLYTRDSSGTLVDTDEGIDSATSPSIAKLTDGSYEVAWRASGSGLLYLRNSSGTLVNTNEGVAAGTSPAITALPNGAYVVAFNANGSNLLYTRDSSGTLLNTKEGVAAGTSPAIAAQPGGSYEVAFNSNGSNLLYTRDSSGTLVNTNEGMATGTNPAITALTDGSYEVAFNANGGLLYTRNSGTALLNTNEGVAAGTSPAIAANSSGGWEVAFNANGSNLLYTRDSSGTLINTNEGMATGTNPAIATQSDGTYEVAFNANGGLLYTRNSGSALLNTNEGVAAGTSPAIAAQ